MKMSISGNFQRKKYTDTRFPKRSPLAFPGGFWKEALWASQEGSEKRPCGLPREKSTHMWSGLLKVYTHPWNT